MHDIVSIDSEMSMIQADVKCTDGAKLSTNITSAYYLLCIFALLFYLLFVYFML